MIEVYNIDFNAEKLQTSDDLKLFLDRRLIAKLQNKLEGIDNLNEGCQLAPVLWGDIMSLANYIEAFDYFKQATIVAPFMMIARYTNQITEQVLYDFGSVEQFLLRVKKRAEGNL
ncbi:MAG: hypothetical protein ACOYU4_03495 [Thermodesulfobacteriota bacterium]